MYLRSTYVPSLISLSEADFYTYNFFVLWSNKIIPSYLD